MATNLREYRTPRVSPISFLRFFLGFVEFPLRFPLGFPWVSLGFSLGFQIRRAPTLRPKPFRASSRRRFWQRGLALAYGGMDPSRLEDQVLRYRASAASFGRFALGRFAGLGAGEFGGGFSLVWGGKGPRHVFFGSSWV